MALARLEEVRDANPVDLIEAVAHHHSWPFEREADDEIVLGVAGLAGNYHLAFSWMDDVEALHLGCSFDIDVPDGRRDELNRLLTLVNGQILIGHFDHWEREGAIVFRQTLLLSGGIEPSETQVEQLLACALEACECYRPACRFVSRSELDAREAMDAVVFETEGEA